MMHLAIALHAAFADGAKRDCEREATTYALGQEAKRHRAGGRAMSTALLRGAFQRLLGPASQLQAQYLSPMQQKASTPDAGQIMGLVRGG
jgi:hypothetical protein